MEIRVTKPGGATYSNAKQQRKEFPNIKEKMRYIINFLNDKANAKTSKDNVSHIKGARFMFLKPNGNFFDTIEYTIGGDSKDVDTLIEIVFDNREN